MAECRPETGREETPLLVEKGDFAELTALAVDDADTISRLDAHDDRSAALCPIALGSLRQGGDAGIMHEARSGRPQACHSRMKFSHSALMGGSGVLGHPPVQVTKCPVKVK
ncbi:lasso RiPP family leader peptide-containing protein [Rhizobium leguminosarum]|uniref:lasso RiPP family leader peptide-containing protein n=1 Tax=Rhizobium leguminosarum TaxID=384 RepID=UPI003D7A1428